MSHNISTKLTQTTQSAQKKQDYAQRKQKYAQRSKDRQITDIYKMGQNKADQKHHSKNYTIKKNIYI